MLILADENIPATQEAFSAIGEVRTMPGRQMCADDVRDADILLVRSVTRVDERLLSGSKVGFVGSATIGTDHVDLPWLTDLGIRFANAPASNAVSAAEYVISALLHVTGKYAINLRPATVGIIGCGMIYPFALHAYAYRHHKHDFVPSLLAGAGIVVAGLFVRYLVVASAIPLAL